MSELTDCIRSILSEITPGPWLAISEHYGAWGCVHPVVIRETKSTELVGGHDISLDAAQNICELLPPPEGWKDSYDLDNQPEPFYTTEEMDQANIDASFIAQAPRLLAEALARIEELEAKNASQNP